MSQAEKLFTAKYPHANVRPGTTHPFEVYAGDYLCSEGLSRVDAFRRALAYEESGSIQPDPNEVVGGAR